MSISVIVPIFNSEKTLRHCIDSILCQTFRDFELLLIDDGSTDSSTDICDEYAAKDNRVRAFHKENGGVSSARNTGLDNAAGKWVTFCDSDDYVNKDWLSLFMEHCKDDTDMIVQSLENPKSIDYINYEGYITGFIEKFHDLNLIGYIWNKMFLSKVIKENKIRFNESFTFLEDEVFVYEYLQYIDKVAFIPEVAYHYNIPDFSNKYPGDNFEPHYLIFNIIRKIHSRHPIPDAYTFYIKILRRSLFDSFLKDNTDCKDKLARYQQILNENPSVIKSYPFIWRTILGCRLGTAYIILKIMSYIRKLKG